METINNMVEGQVNIYGCHGQQSCVQVSIKELKALTSEVFSSVSIAFHVDEGMEFSCFFFDLQSTSCKQYEDEEKTCK